MKKFLFLLIIIASFSCNKEKKAAEISCENIQNITLLANSPVVIGEPITINTQEVGGYRVYSWVGPDYFTSQYVENTINEAHLANEGWYYLHLNGLDATEGCEKIDSVYIDVTLPQGNPSCGISENTAQYNNLSDDTYSYVTKSIDPTYSLLRLYANNGIYSNLSIQFDPYWRTEEPEDGIYTTSNVPTFDQTEKDYNKVYVSTTKENFFWSSAPDQTVYVSHVNGKLQVRFCDLQLGNGTYQTNVSANVMEK